MDAKRRYTYITVQMTVFLLASRPEAKEIETRATPSCHCGVAEVAGSDQRMLREPSDQHPSRARERMHARFCRVSTGSANECAVERARNRTLTAIMRPNGEYTDAITL
jgi:hypothetical protein